MDDQLTLTLALRELLDLTLKVFTAAFTVRVAIAGIWLLCCTCPRRRLL